MDGHAYIGELFSAVFFIIAGARLLRLSRRTRGRLYRGMGSALRGLLDEFGRDDLVRVLSPRLLPALDQRSGSRRTVEFASE